MTDPTQLPHLLALLDDDDPSVRTAVRATLAAFGDDLAHELRMLPSPPDEDRIDEILAVVRSHTHPDASDGTSGQPGAALVTDMLFRAGDLVHHRRYGYRGVIVSADVCCQTPDMLTGQNQSLPPREQPWYHVLVHGAPRVAYAAQSSLKPDASGRPIRHPLVAHYFGALVEGRYERNERPWPDTV
jgi:heat shock protein HspQ